MARVYRCRCPGHRREVERFTEVVVADGVRFHAITYQELIARLGEHRDEHPLYVRYLTERYLWGVRAATNIGRLAPRATFVQAAEEERC